MEGTVNEVKAIPEPGVEDTREAVLPGMKAHRDRRMFLPILLLRVPLPATVRRHRAAAAAVVAVGTGAVEVRARGDDNETPNQSMP